MDAFNLITMTLPGVAVTYQGEEIGMTNGEVSYQETVDPAGCNCGPDRGVLINHMDIKKGPGL